MNRKSLLIFAALAAATVLSACSSSAPIAISLTTPPPSTIEVNQMASIAATVTHDHSDAGVDWTCTPSPCGSFNPAHTASGASTVWTAPSTAGSVTITADATANPSMTATASVTVNPVATVSNITGTYAYYANGWDINGNAISVAGSITFDTTGDITTGEQDYFDSTTPIKVFTSDPITMGMGALTVGSNGQGTLTITPTSAPAETLAITVVNNSHILITEFDGNATTAGSLDLQTSPTSLPASGNAFALYDAQNIYVFGGVLTSNGTTFTAGEGDDDIKGAASYDFTIATASFTGPPDSFGRFTVTLVDPNEVLTQTYGAYVVGPEVFRLIEYDGTGFATGSMFGQGTTSGSFALTSLNGSFAFGQEGQTGEGFGFYGAAGQFTTAGAGTLTAGVADVNEGDGAPVVAGSLATGGTYTVKSDGYGGIALTADTTDTLANFGTYYIDPTLNIVDPNNTSNPGGALMLDLDANSLGIGVIAPQTSGASFVGNYAINDDGAYMTTTTSPLSFFDFVGQATSDGSANLDGTVSYNDLDNTGQVSGDTLAIAWTADTANPGHFTSTETLGTNTPIPVNFYQANSSLLFHVDMNSAATDSGTVGFGVTEQQQ